MKTRFGAFLARVAGRFSAFVLLVFGLLVVSLRSA